MGRVRRRYKSEEILAFSLSTFVLFRLFYKQLYICTEFPIQTKKYVKMADT